jgi:hypothetical protein
MDEFPILYEGKEYAYALSSVKRAIEAQNRRNRYTVSVRNKRPNPFNSEPRKPSRKQLELLAFYHRWRDFLKNKPDEWWFERIDSAIEEKFYRAKLYCLIWWELCEQQDLDDDAWRRRMAGYDFDRDLECDWELVEYALHCCGFHPVKARSMSFEAKDRRVWRAHRRKVFKCFECDAERTNLNFPPQRCESCGVQGSMEEK